MHSRSDLAAISEYISEEKKSNINGARIVENVFNF